jgi:hypothetical protein
MGGAAAIAAPVLGIAGGLISGSKAADAAKGQSEALRAAADKASAMAQFKPYGMTTAFGTSAFTPEGQGSYTLSPQLKAIQDQLFAQAGATDSAALGQAAQQPLMGGSQSLFNLGQQYLATSPEQAAQDYITQQRGLLSAGREQQLSGIRNQLAQSGRAGLSVGGTESGNIQASNPELQAYYNALAQQEAQLAANADIYGRERTTYGAGLLGTGGDLLKQLSSVQTAGYDPLRTQLGLLGTTETMGQQPFLLSQDLANQYSQAGARAGQLYLQPQAAAAQAYSQYQGYSPLGTALSGAGSAMGGGGSSWFNSLLSSGGGSGGMSQTTPSYRTYGSSGGTGGGYGLRI